MGEPLECAGHGLHTGPFRPLRNVATLAAVSDVAVVRAPGANLSEKRNYRPKTLRAVIRKHAGEWGIT